MRDQSYIVVIIYDDLTNKTSAKRLEFKTGNGLL